MKNFRYNKFKKTLGDNDYIIVIDAFTNKEKKVQYYNDKIIIETGHFVKWNEYFKNNAPKEIFSRFIDI